jgi:hypothetical protein
MKVWVVDSGGYEDNYIDKIFRTEEAATQYAKQKNDEEAVKVAALSYRATPDLWSVCEYDVSD